MILKILWKFIRLISTILIGLVQFIIVLVLWIIIIRISQLLLLRNVMGFIFLKGILSLIFIKIFWTFYLLLSFIVIMMSQLMRTNVVFILLISVNWLILLDLGSIWYSIILFHFLILHLCELFLFKDIHFISHVFLWCFLEIKLILVIGLRWSILVGYILINHILKCCFSTLIVVFIFSNSILRIILGITLTSFIDRIYIFKTF